MTTNKTVTILVRYLIKNTQVVICTVRNGEDKEYSVALHKSGNTTCTCKHGESAGNRAHCYHVKAVQVAEIARREAAETARAYRELAFSEY